MTPDPFDPSSPLHDFLIVISPHAQDGVPSKERYYVSCGGKGGFGEEISRVDEHIRVMIVFHFSQVDPLLIDTIKITFIEIAKNDEYALKSIIAAVNVTYENHTSITSI